jgi:phospholipid/cholesterol/gamma-HCH transport system ATP-binding protein
MSDTHHHCARSGHALRPAGHPSGAGAGRAAGRDSRDCRGLRDREVGAAEGDDRFDYVLPPGRSACWAKTRMSKDRRRAEALRRRWGVLFQEGALFSALSVAQNILMPMREFTNLNIPLRRDLTAIKIGLVGLPQEAADKRPSELSGGMKKRVGLARALALDPEILFLDEPTAGLDPIGANAFDELILSLRRSLGLTVVMITHDLDSLITICDRIAVLVDKRVVTGTLDELMQNGHPWIRDYFGGPRGRAVLAHERA